MYFTDFAYIYVIATILHPSLKIENLSKLIDYYYHYIGLPKVMWIITLETIGNF